MLDYCALVLAIEFPVTANGIAQHANYFERSVAQALANQLSFEIAKHLPKSQAARSALDTDNLDGLGLVWMAACYDQAQILRPEFPIHTALHGLYQSGVRDGQLPQVMTLQALRGEAPMPLLRVETELLGGPMVLVPFALIGTSQRVAEARELLESKLLDAGLTDARTAMMLNQALGADAEHARLMTLDDLAALCAIQLENVGLGEIWKILERALFHPASSLSGEINSIPYSLLDKQFNIELPSLATVAEPSAHMAQQFNSVMQAIAVLRAHGLVIQDTLRAFGALDTHPDYWIDWALDDEVERFEIAHTAEFGIFGYLAYNSSQQRIAWAVPRNPRAHRALKERFANAVFQKMID
jgi:hypothetical protein